MKRSSAPTSVPQCLPAPVRAPLRPAIGGWLLFAMCLALAHNGHAEPFALLVGIEQYRNLHAGPDQLTGPGNDVKNLRQMLVREYGFRDENIVTLRDGQATLADVRREFQQLAARLGRDDTFVFHFSGHGTELLDDNGDERADAPDDVRDEGLCLHDFTTRGDGVLRDDELGTLLDGLAAGEAVVVLDCCHSGTATRGLGAPGAIRYWPVAMGTNAPPTVRTPRLEAPLAHDLRSAAGGQRRIVISACAAVQQARELDHRIAPLKFSSGSLTYYLVQGLRGAGDSNGDGCVSYAEAHGYALRRINELYNGALDSELDRQTPLLEATPAAARDAPAFGVPAKPPMYARVVWLARDQARLDLGAIHGLLPDSRLGLFRDQAALSAGQSAGEIRITQVELESALAAPVRAPVDSAACLAGPLADPLAPADVFLRTERAAVAGALPQDEATRLLRDVNARLTQLPQVRIDADTNWDLHLVLDREPQGTSATRITVRCAERNGHEHEPREFPLQLPLTAGDRERCCDQLVAWLEPLIAAVRARRTLAGLTHPRPGFGLQAVVNRLPEPGTTLAEYRQGDALVFGLKSTAACWYYIVAIDPQGKPEVWCPRPGEGHQAPANVKLLHPGPREMLTVAGPPGVYVVKLLAVREELPRDAFPDGLPRPEVFRALPPEQWSESSVSFRLLPRGAPDGPARPDSDG